MGKVELMPAVMTVAHELERRNAERCHLHLSRSPGQEKLLGSGRF